MRGWRRDKGMGLMGRRKYAQVFGSGAKFPQARLKRKCALYAYFHQTESFFTCLLIYRYVFLHKGLLR
jgi:hypothetical protein